MKRLAFALICLLLAALACNAPPETLAPTQPPPIRPTKAPVQLSQPTEAPPQPPQPTQAPTRPPAIQPTWTPVKPLPEPTGGIEGSICYPSDFIPPMTIYAVNQDSGEWYQTRPESQTDTDYEFEAITPGTYVVYAWLDEGDQGGSYSQAVPCGLGVECEDHSLVPVIVESGLTSIAVDVCDWYGPLPPPPPG